jgi:uncharacterized membrane protein YfcA
MDWFDPALVVAGLLIGIVVGLTGMGGGALMTPVLVFFFRVDTLTAISSDVLISLFMKPAGAIVHLRRGTVHLRLVAWLCLGSVPAAFLGAVIIGLVDARGAVEGFLKVALGVALLVAASGLIVRAWLALVQRGTIVGEGPTSEVEAPQIRVRRLPTVLLGAAAGLIVGLTSVGAGSIIIVVLLLLYPRLKASQLVGTDLVQAIPLVAAATLGHLIYGEVSFGIAGSVLIGAIPGAIIGAQISSRAPGGLIRRALAVLLLASGLALLGAPTEVVVGSAVAALVLGNIAWILVRRRYNARRSAGRDPEPAEPKAE